MSDNQFPDPIALLNSPSTPAFPMGYHPEWNSADHTGMTLRDYFAAAALQGLMAYYGGFCDQDAKAAYSAADAMIRAKEAKL